jgi:prepilin-type N-terminal cleavage/methylation domain-containing protein
MVNMRGFTLIELMVTLAILAMLLLMAAPLAADWVHGARTLQARGTLVQGFENAKALALRNPCADPNATGTPAAAALEAKIEGTTVTLNVLALPQGVSGCALLGARPNPQWTARLPDGVGLTLNGTLLTTSSTPLTVNLDNRGLPAASIPFTLRRGGHQNDETGTLH